MSSSDKFSELIQKASTNTSSKQLDSEKPSDLILDLLISLYDMYNAKFKYYLEKTKEFHKTIEMDESMPHLEKMLAKRTGFYPLEMSDMAAKKIIIESIIREIDKILTGKTNKKEIERMQQIFKQNMPGGDYEFRTKWTGCLEPADRKGGDPEDAS